ncbi:sigma 54-interacting transcriptional regulator [Salinibacter altiplanensis]|uniref:sigma 54-interacting transcriptional regulator n=1 Tax=Salinibacter altiplanensis TaxID=1803181 RepID=UPI000C9FC3D1|nr:sigma 54-interacting transcriptional regulator [Salinibacter altiplanensis]
MSTDEPLHILMLEDVATDAELVERELDREGFNFEARRVTTENAFREALEALDPDIILVDYSLPQFDGMAALGVAQAECPHIPVVFVSGAIGEERAIETLKQGATDYVLKDKLSRLGPAVRRALQEAAERRARREAEAALRQAHDELEQKVAARTAELREANTALKEEVDERKRAERALRKSRERLTRIIDSAIDAIISIDADLQVHLFNEAAEEIFQRSAEAVEGTPLAPFLTDPFEAVVHRHIDAHQEAQGSDGAPETDGRYLAAPEGLEARRGDGTTFPVEATLCPIQLPAEDRYLIILRDVDDRKQAEEEVAQLESERSYLQEELESEYNFDTIVGTSAPMQEVFDAIDQVADTETTVLVTGETGTGKELVARALHARSARSDQVFVTVNCAALSTDLIESELFGHEKGAFTGATTRREGRFELADEGTILLDEIGELPLETQAKLLRVLQQQTFERVGGSETIEVDTRILAATNRDLAAAVEADAFRSDLYYRLNIFPIELPPLRDRGDDLPLLAEHFRETYASRTGTDIEGFSAEAMATLKDYDWPGNVRELANIIERAVILTRGRHIRAEHLSVTGSATDGGNVQGPSSLATLEEAQRRHIERALEQTDGVVGGDEGAAQLLDVKRTTLLSRMKRLGIAPSEYRA